METKVYDPRDDTQKDSNNPALIMATYLKLVAQAKDLELRSDYWLEVAEWADYLDEEVGG